MKSVLALAIAATDAVAFIARSPAAPSRTARDRTAVALACASRIGAIVLAYIGVF
ncbi:hypothetical protein ABWH74_001538 [Burkholderia vietnamiensis]|jgi:hypothetical protein|nr:MULTISPECIES: hypothetical protein [Burkholderia]MBR8217557.1 hypothetical protein [Burkholderia vietnamiensis]MBR8231719.1 hypothetical protein [Burkholderia vietnamiensis]MCA7986274.1 hypothetical protein [Burkholderia vietnamiensis]MCA8149069.1 hypothetical protein [Burkholderia vietnamiensis]MCA8197109.1 hypothetical protein [Burkholderia vietnamiensis]